MSKADEKNKYFGEWNFENIVARIDEFKLGTKIRSETGDVYNLNQAEGEGKQRKFSRWNGTRLRFMTYENIGKKFEIIEEEPEIDIQGIEETNELLALKSVDYRVSTEENLKRIDKAEIDMFYELIEVTRKQNEILKAIKQLDKQIKEK